MIEEASSMDRAIKRRSRFVARMLLLLALTAALVTAGVLLYPSLSRWVAADRSVDASSLRFGKVVRGDLQRDVSVEGKIVAADHPTIVSPAQGIVSILAKAGEVVTRAAVLARVESPEIQSRLKQEQSSLLSMKSELERQKISARQGNLQNMQQVSLLEVKLEAAQRSMKRFGSLLEQGLGNAIDYEKSQDDVKVANLELGHAREKTKLDKETADFEIRNKELQVQRQELVVKELERKISELSVVSPVSGLVARVDVKDKDMVQPNQALFSVVDLSRYQIEIEVPEEYAREITPGTGAVILYDTKEFEGTVKSISPEVESSQVKGVVVFGSAAPVGLKENQRVNTRLVLDSRRSVLKIPRGPFLENLGGRGAYVVQQNMATLRPISVGAVSITEVEILSGLKEGQEIILSDVTRFEGAKTVLLRR